MVTLLEIFLACFLALFSACFPGHFALYIQSDCYFFIAVTTDLSSYSCFAIAPLLVLWLGYGLASKVAMTILMAHFLRLPSPVMTASRNTPEIWLNWHKPCKLLVGKYVKVCRRQYYRACIRFTHSRFHCTDWRSHRRMGCANQG